MLMYLAAFAVSIGLAACGEGLYQKKNQKGGVACLVLAVLVAALLAGLRDVSVGTDSVVYEEWFRYAWNMDGWGDYLFKAYAKTEPFFMSLIYLASRLGSAVQGVYFLIGLCTYAEKLHWICCFYGTWTSVAQHVDFAVGCDFGDLSDPEKVGYLAGQNGAAGMHGSGGAVV